MRTSVAPTRAARLKPLLVVAGVFVLGGVAGAAAARAYTLEEVKPRPGSSRAELRADAMRRNLGLDQQQVDALLPILRASEEARREAQGPCQADLDAIRADSDAKIRALLTADQRTRYEEQSARWRR